MKIIGISGSPRAGGNTEVLLQHALEPFRRNGWTVVKFLLSHQTVAPCRGCDGCLQTSCCVIEDDMRVLYEEFAACDAIIIASPVYYRNVTAQLKAVFDRCYATRDAHPLAGKAGGAIVVGRGTGGGQGLALSIIYNFFLSSGAICVPGELNGVSAVAGEPGEILTQPRRLEQARILGENVLRFAELLAKAEK
ncbi:MAG: flavodoxin family protein [Anaerolineae bacterium]|nr:flavodoxin family protein [Anaerolineae bacterium]